MSRYDEFFIHISDKEKILHMSGMTPKGVDNEMGMGKNSEILRICGMDQESLEHFAQHYGKTYRYLEFFKCPKIWDFSPLEDLANLEKVNVFWNIRADNLWNFSKNTALKSILISDAKKMTFNPDKVKTSSVLEDVWFAGGMFNNYPVESLDAFTGMPALKRLRLHNIRLNRKNLEALSAMPALERFDFDAGMLTTEEIAWIVAKYPHLSGNSLCAYNTEDAVLTDVRVCGFRKPGLDLPEHQKRLDKYVAQFNALVEKYRNEP